MNGERFRPGGDPFAAIKASSNSHRPRPGGALMTTALLRTGEALAEAVRRCRQAQPRWRDEPVRKRLGPVRALRCLVVAECDRLCAAAEQDIGKPAVETIGAEVLPLAAALK